MTHFQTFLFSFREALAFHLLRTFPMARLVICFFYFIMTFSYVFMVFQFLRTGFGICFRDDYKLMFVKVSGT